MSERGRVLGLRMVDALNRRDAEEMKGLTHPEAEFAGMRSALEGTTYAGHEGIDRFLADIGDVWDEVRIVDPEILERGDRALIVCRLFLRGRGSGAVVEHEMAWLIEVREGLMFRTTTTLDVDGARREFERG